MKIDVNKSTVYSFDRLSDLTKSVLLLGEKGYFSDCEDFSEYEYGILTEVTVNYIPKDVYPFKRCVDGADTVYGYFIPESKVVFKKEPKEKKYRPYTDMCGLPFKVGDVITIRAKDSYDIIEAIVTEISYKENLISIGSREWCDTQFLLDTFEILINDEWVPLGVLNEED